MQVLEDMRKEHLREFAKMIANTSDTPEHFQAILLHAFRYYGFRATQCAKDLGVGRSAISKWVNGTAIPNAPTRKAVTLWIIDQINTVIQ